MGSSEATLTLVLKAKNLASREVDKLHGALDRAGVGARRFGSILATVGKVGILAVVAGAVALIGVLGKATKMAAEEEVGIRRLDAALKQNVKGYNGNRDAIEDLIAKREALAFTDDELRDSMSKLVTKFKDVDAAAKVQAVAMDVARLKGTDLGAATDLVSKAMSGNKRALKDLGIVMEEGASQTEILTAIQKKAAGQAEAYGKTSAAAQKVAQNAMNNFLEDVGGAFLPIMTGFFTLLTTKVIPAIRDVATRIKRWLDANKPLVDQIKAFVGGVLSTLFTLLGKVAGKIMDVVNAIANNKDAMNFLKTVIGLIAGGFGLAGKAIGKLVGFVGGVIDSIRDLIGWIKDAINWLGKLGGAKGKVGAPGDPWHPPRHAEGGWVGLNGPEIGLLGEKGPEFIRKAGTGTGDEGGGQGVRIVGVSRSDLARMIDRDLYFKLQRAAPTAVRT